MSLDYKKRLESPLSAFIASSDASASLSFSPSPHHHHHHHPPPIHNIIKRRRRLTVNEQSILQRVFDACPKPSAIVRDKLAERLGMSRRCIQIWFQNRRAKHKRDQQDAKQPALLFRPTTSRTSKIEESLEDTGFDEKQLEELLNSCTSITSGSLSMVSTASLISSPDEDVLISDGSAMNESDIKDIDWLQPNWVTDSDPMLPESLIVDQGVLEANIIALEKQQQQSHSGQHQFEAFLGGSDSTNDLFDLYLAI